MSKPRLERDYAHSSYAPTKFSLKVDNFTDPGPDLAAPIIVRCAFCDWFCETTVGRMAETSARHRRRHRRRSQ